MHQELTGQHWLITGSTGIAAATARLAAQSGARVFIIGIDENTCRELFAELSVIGDGHGFAVADVSSAPAVEQAVAAAAQLPRIDALFNVAGISGRRFGDGPAHECTPEAWDVTLDTNAKSTWLMCRAVLRVMLEQSLDARGLRGTILNMGSVLGGLSPEPKHFATHAYAASKAAITGMSQAMAAYYAPHKIRINVIAPSLVRTPMSARAQGDAALLDYITRKHPLGETMLEPDDVAHAALFLLSPAASRITGEVLTVDAGWSVTNE
ncbi:MAG: SDR family oxidoreductase [Acidobacteria bacterium]|nr:SDR family oxidoreductase [Acidobacteriota bacterium]